LKNAVGLSLGRDIDKNIQVGSVVMIGVSKKINAIQKPKKPPFGGFFGWLIG